MTTLSGGPAGEQWIDDDAGRIVRPYVMTRGRTTPSRGRIDLVALVATTAPAIPAEPGFGPEHHAIVEICRRPLSVAEIAARLDLPAGTVRVLLGDLADRGHVAIHEPPREEDLLDLEIYQAVLEGLRTL
ncbi:DUF742 domain-containing protein [Sphaerisporangium fuscum]|uniref:DUF742 domain-containing protein n=1 Tax=Sphaerisporangium fuscum TaxID=2835868 RepID=UPI001BDBC961|nr:DUF742 domain-containing protein [Sphaerisporangium fuscum]